MIRLILIFILWSYSISAMDTPLIVEPITAETQLIQIHHLACDFMKCYIPDDVVILEEVMRRAARRSGAKDLEFVGHKFGDGGLSGTLILAESHISIHYWSQQRYASIDIVTCGKCDPQKALEYLKHKLKPLAVVCKNIPRSVE